jgi:hypothetical protein
VLRIFIALKNPSPWPGVEPATFGSSGQHTNQYTTKATYKSYYCCKATEHKTTLVKERPMIIVGRHGME